MLQQTVQPATMIKEEICPVATQSSVSIVQDNKTMSRQRKGLSRQQQHTTMRNSVVTEENIVTTKVEKNYTKNVAT